MEYSYCVIFDKIYEACIDYNRNQYDKEVMEYVTNLEDFIQENDKDMNRILYVCFRNFVLESDGREDLKQDLYLHFLRNKVIEKYDPKRGIPFSSYMCMCIERYLCGYKSKYLYKYKPSWKKLDVSLDDPSMGKFLEPYLAVHGADIINSIFLKQVYANLVSLPDRKVKLQFHQYFEKFLMGKQDKDISEDTGITIAGVGVIKRKIRKEILALS